MGNRAVALCLLVVTLSLSACVTTQQPVSPPTTALASQVLVREVVRLGTLSLLAWHPELRQPLALWSRAVSQTITPAVQSFDAIGPRLLASLDTHGWTLEQRQMVTEGLQVMMSMAHVALAHAEPQTGAVVLTVAQVAGWIADVAEGK